MGIDGRKIRSARRKTTAQTQCNRKQQEECYYEGAVGVFLGFVGVFVAGGK
jgi:hypothetical protein